MTKLQNFIPALMYSDSEVLRKHNINKELDTTKCMTITYVDLIHQYGALTRRHRKILP